MKQRMMILGLAAVLALPLLATPLTASASCAQRKTTGTVVGGVGGALIGNAVIGGVGGTVAGGLGGAVLGHEVARGGCYDDRRGARATHHHHRRHRSHATSHPAPDHRP